MKNTFKIIENQINHNEYVFDLFDIRKNEFVYRITLNVNEDKLSDAEICCSLPKEELLQDLKASVKNLLAEKIKCL